MNKKLKDFLETGLLDKYVIGDTTILESKKVETYLNTYPELQEKYQILQDELDITSRANAVKPSIDALDNILSTIHDTTLIEMSSKPKIPYWFSIAASIAALIFAGTTIVLYTQSEDLKDENNTIAEEIFDLRDDIDNNNQKLDNVMSELKKLNDPETYKYVLRGNDRAKDLKTVAYINPIKKSSLIDVVSLPKLSDKQYYKMWAQVNNKMVDLGTLKATGGNLKQVPYIEDALSLSITIEDENSTDTASTHQEVAQIELENN